MLPSRTSNCLFNGPWDEDFLIVPPGKRIVARNDDMVLDTGSRQPR